MAASVKMKLEPLVVIDESKSKLHPLGLVSWYINFHQEPALCLVR